MIQNILACRWYESEVGSKKLITPFSCQTHLRIDVTWKIWDGVVRACVFGSVGGMQVKELPSLSYWSEGRIGVIVQIWGLVYEIDALKITLRNYMYLTKLCFVQSSL